MRRQTNPPTQRTKFFLGRRDLELTLDALAREGTTLARLLTRSLLAAEARKGKHGALRIYLAADGVALLSGIYADARFDRAAGKRLLEKLTTSSRDQNVSRRKRRKAVGGAVRNSAAAGRPRRVRLTTGR